MTAAADNIISITCQPDTNLNILQYSVLRIRIRVGRRDGDMRGSFRVVVRTNINQSQRVRRQIIDEVEKGQSYSTDYYDLPTIYNPFSDEFYADVLVYEVGYFEFKVRVESSRTDEPWVKWMPGANVGISVTPVEYGRDNAVYCAFIRQFGDNKDRASLKNPRLEQTIQELESQGAYVIGPGGDFTRFTKELPFIIKELGVRIIHLLPINPVPTSYGRMGLYGSPYATTDYFGIDQGYGSFSRYKTIEDQLVDVTSTIHGLGAKVILDMVINHTGWASSILFTHRQWIKADRDRQIISPGAWGVTWGDLVELDYSHQDLWQYMAKVFLVWCQRGIDGFRLDAGYKIPQEVWRYIIARVREEFPNTLFLLEGLGGPWATTEKLLTEGMMNWAYSELFQNYTRRQIVDYLRYAQRISATKGTMVHYAETHDNDRLATKGKAYALMRLYVCGFTSFSGAWGFTNGVEWLATEKIDVHRNSGLNWGSSDNLVREIKKINEILRGNPAFWQRDNLEMAEVGNDEVLAFVRSNSDYSNVVACAINLNCQQAQRITWDFAEKSLKEHTTANTYLYELLGGGVRELPQTKIVELKLAAGDCQIYRLETTPTPREPRAEAIYEVEPDKIALIYRILLSRFQPHEVGRINQEKLLRSVTNFRKFIVLVNTAQLEELAEGDLSAMLAKVEEKTLNRYSAIWTFDEGNKEYIIPGDKWLITQTLIACTAYLKTAETMLSMDAIRSEDGSGFLTFFPPLRENQRAALTFNWKIQHEDMIKREWQEGEYHILSIPSGIVAAAQPKVYPLRLSKDELQEEFATVLLSNGKGGYCQCPAHPGKWNSKYDGLLVVTPEMTKPAERLALVKAFRETIKVGEKYFDLDESFLINFTRFPHPLWEYIYDDGEFFLHIERKIIMPAGENSLYINYKLRRANAGVTLYCKCYLECRNPHEQLKANDALQQHYSRCCRSLTDEKGVEFSPRADTKVKVVCRSGRYIEQPLWTFNVYFPQDDERGLPARGDIFSPGVFSCELSRDESQGFLITTHTDRQAEFPGSRIEIAENKRVKDLLSKAVAAPARKDSLIRILITALDQFIVHTGKKWLMAGGYPWLPAGTREGLYCVGGLLAAGREDVAADVILNAAATQSDGLLTDWIDIGGQKPTNVEAALRLFVAADSLVKATNDNAFWERQTEGGSTVRQALVDIYNKLTDPGRKEGPRLDESSGLLYCPAGYSWMNTQYPQATPREGYPVEIQSLWYQALAVAAKIYPEQSQRAAQLRELIAQKFMSLYWNEQVGYLADVLSAQRRTAAGQATADTAMRYNQLSAVHADLVPQRQARQIVDTVARKLLIPGGLRSLSREALSVPLKVYDERGQLLMDPRMPYQGWCRGDERARRLAYHNGTAWPVAYPSFIEARARIGGFSESAVRRALAFFEPAWSQFASDGIGTISEMKDGNYPHRPRGCYAYAPAVAETLRVYMQLKYQLPQERK